MSKDLDNYNKLKDDLVKKIIEKNDLSNKLSELEDAIYDKEYNYFQESYYGNIVKGFDNFSKTSNSSNFKKKLPFGEGDHIFSLSSYNYVKSLKRGGLDFDEYEDSVEVPLGVPLAKPVEPASSTSTPSRKRKIRSLDE